MEIKVLEDVSKRQHWWFQSVPHPQQVRTATSSAQTPHLLSIHATPPQRPTRANSSSNRVAGLQSASLLQASYKWCCTASCEHTQSTVSTGVESNSKAWAAPKA
uniref:Uncharacterized protein n=1 Tax=Chlamydomonas euryale TaxID=1486919 RepID=A0A7R9YRX1_9CHLO